MADAQTLSPIQIAGLDDPAVLTQCQLAPRDGAGLVSIGLGLAGLHCASCALAVESALRGQPGVSEVQVQGATQRARVVIDPSQAKLSALVQAVMGAGFQAWPDGSASAGMERIKLQRQLLWRLLVAAFCMMQVMMVTVAQYVAGRDEIPPDIWNLLNWAAWVLSLPVLVFSCGPFFEGAWAALKHGRIAMDTPVALGIAAMFGVSTGVMFGYTDWLGHDLYLDSLTMFVTFLMFGRWLESRARERVTQSLESLCARLPEAVERSQITSQLNGDMTALTQSRVDMVPISALRAGDYVRVSSGQAFPADGQLVWGQTEVDEALLTGESRPVPRGAGQTVIAGSLNISAPVWCLVERVGADTRYQQVVNLVQQALTDKPGWLRIADRFAGPFLWTVLVLALLGGLAWQWIDPSKSVWVAVSVLVVTCPCALSLAAPSALLAAAGALAKGGVLVRHLDALEALAHVRHVFFDKTGTLTSSQPQLTQLWWAGRVWPVEDMPQAAKDTLQHAASLALLSQHPVAQGLATWAGPASAWHEVIEQAGAGLQGLDAAGVRWRLGSAAWALPAQASHSAWADARVWFAANTQSQDQWLGIGLDEQVRPEAAAALQALRDSGVGVALLSGDQTSRVQAFAEQLALTPPMAVAAAQASPEDKLALIAKAEQQGETLAVVGDGINDAPVLARAQVSFAMDHGAALAQSQADFIVLGGRLGGIPMALKTSRKAMQIVRQNLIWAAVYNLVCIPLALAGYLPPWLAGLGMAMSSLGVMLNALRVANG